jgi:HK97 family phage prohead protease
MSKKILIGKDGKLPLQMRAKISTTEKSGSKLAGKAVVFRLSKDSHPIAGVVKSVEGSVATVKLALPNHDGLLVCSKDATIIVSVEDLREIDAPYKETDVKRWDSSQPLSSKAAVEVTNADGLVVDYRNVTFDGFGSTFAATTPEDRDGDNIPPGAFKNLPEFRQNPVMLTDHTRKVLNLMGSYSRVAPNDRGLAVTGNLTNSMHPDAVHTRALVAEGHLKTLSIGGAFFYDDDFRTILEILLYEISLVVVPANPDALFQVRSLDADFAEKAFRHHAKMHGGEVRLQQIA